MKSLKSSIRTSMIEYDIGVSGLWELHSLSEVHVDFTRCLQAFGRL
jgi:hypothetical protein